jgi:hypothetical protein
VRLRISLEQEIDVMRCVGDSSAIVGVGPDFRELQVGRWLPRKASSRNKLPQMVLIRLADSVMP